MQTNQNRTFKPVRFALLGEHLSHSFSKTIHELFSRHRYDLVELDEDELQSQLDSDEYSGYNVTIPYKQSVIPMLDESSKEMQGVGACNTIVVRNGKKSGFNTDYDGIAATFQKAGVDVKGKKAAILGRGGARKAFEAYLRNHDAAEILIVYYRNAEDSITYQELLEKHPDIEILINATPVGMYPKIADSPLDLRPFKNLEFVFDAIYNPLQTKLLEQARELDIPYSNGLLMLVEQARKAHEYFLEKRIPQSLSDHVYNSVYKDALNIVLIGMPSSGKSTLAQILGEKLDKTVIDLDHEIERRQKRSIPDIFEEGGEPLFRDIETRVLKKVAGKTGIILATGGGTILKEENVNLLKQNGLVFYLDRPLEKLVSHDENRPLLKKGIENLYVQRKGFYESASDLIIENDSSLEQAARDIIHEYYKY